ncbi:phosphatase domain-containing putative toxin [Nocardia sp. CDC160]|uniref:phosphatase domain-containing putative toxin n=1 Tax=Nocardia sp. CDC160 TaxID=3112166 RepID=UPI002DB682B8|nr:hypothetical protein [Nocardia sp. CDC160]MEC3915682.1 hypothetical protein [Nocardia sp. CDC160]
MMVRGGYRLTACLCAAIAAVGVGGCGSEHESASGPTTPAPATLIVDFLNTPGLPEHFRTTASPLAPTAATPPSLVGFDSLRESGSTDPSRDGWQSIADALPPGTRYDIDLRQETHLYVDGMVVSWYGERDDANMGMTTQQVLDLQARRVKELTDARDITFGILPGKSATPPMNPLTGPRTVDTEQQVVTPLGFTYEYLPVPDGHMPSPQTVDEFLAFTRSLPADAWLHFHCREGHGRTTTFMAMYDMMRNAKQVSLDDIIARQHLIGGADLATDQAAQPFIPSFYEYARQNTDDFHTPYSTWLAAHPS